MKIRSCIDLGTNTCLLLVMQGDEVLLDRSTVVRLGEGVDKNSVFQALSMQRTLACLKLYAQELSNLGAFPQETLCVATSQARDAKNSLEFFREVKKMTGFQFQVLSGEQEARFSFLGALLPGLEPEKTAVIDIGGGSTEMITAQQCHSFDVGAVRFTERYFFSDPVKSTELEACEKAIDEVLQGFSFSQDLKGFSFLGVAGTVTSLAAWQLGLKEFRSSLIDEVVLRSQDVCAMLEKLKKLSLKERMQLPCMEPLRADVILAGCMILWRIMDLFQVSQCRVSSRGLRYGVLGLQVPLQGLG